MADTQSTIYGQAYSRNIMQLAQQKFSKLINCVYMKPNVRGKVFYQDQIGEWSMSTKGGRNVATPNNDPALARRMGTMVDYHDNRMLDRGDELKTISDPRSAYTIAAAQSLGRKIDDVILAGLVNDASYGETGSSSATQGNTRIVTSNAITLADIVAIKGTMDDDDVDIDDRYIAMTPTAMASLLNVEQATSGDYNTIKALVRGEIDTWMGFKWIQSTRVSALTTCAGIAFQRYGICLAMGDRPMVRTDERKDLSYSWQIYYELNIGSVRLEEEKAVTLYTA